MSFLIIGMTTKYCNNCKKDLEKTAFSQHKSKKDGLASTCKACMIIIQKKYYATNSSYYKERSAFLKKDIREKVIAIKENSPCSDCGTSYPYYVMQFDHTSDNKEFNIGNAVVFGISEQRVLEEIAKCDLVCANCHCQRTHNRRLAKKLVG